MKDQKNRPSIIAQFAHVAATSADIAAQKYGAYRARENEKYRAEQARIRAEQAQQAENNYLANIYPMIANFLMTAINDTAAITYILPVPSVDKLEAITKLKRFSNGTTCLVYRWLLRAGVPASTQKNIQGILQRELNVLTTNGDFPPLNVTVRLCPYNEVFFGIAFRNSATQGRK